MKKLLAAMLLFASMSAMAQQIEPFKPTAAGSVTVAVTNSTGATALAATSRTQVMIDNAGPQPAFIEFGTSGVTAAVATGVRIPVGAIMVFTIDKTVTHIAAITASSTATLYVTVGQGD